MTTHTIALFGDWLIATAPDGDAAKLAERIADAKGQGIDFDDADLRIITGLTLIRTMDEEMQAEEAGAEIVYTGTDQGWLEDEHGETGYHAAVRMPPRAARTIDATPTWAGLMPALIALIENGTAEGRATAIAEITRLAHAADTYIAADKAAADQRGDKYRAIIWAHDRTGTPVTIMLTEGEAQDVAAYLMPGHHPATAEIAEQGAKISEAAARSYGGSWPAHLAYRR